MNGHEHDWGPYTDLPIGERPARFRQCRSCRVIGYIRTAAIRFGDRKNREVLPYRCSVRGCPNEATGRLHGRRGPRISFFWVCDEHMEDTAKVANRI